MDLGVPPQRTPRQHDAAAGRVPLAVVVVDADGLVSHWSSGARRLFGPTREQAVGCSAGEFLPVSGALRQAVGIEDDGDLDGFGPEPEGLLSGTVAYPAAGRARVDEPEHGRIDVLWWAYPLVGPGTGRLLVLAADAAQLRDADWAEGPEAETIAPGFALHTDFPGYQELAGRLPEILPSMSVHEATRIVAQILELGYPVLETVRVRPGDRLVLCTDGLVEVRGQDIGAGLAALCASAAHPAASTDDACDTIIRALNPSGGRKDDVALLMARLNGIPDGNVAEWQLALDPREVARSRRLVRGKLLDWDLPDAVEAAELMVSELVTNAVKYGRTHHIGLRLVRTRALLCEVSDDEPAPATLLDATADDESGRGLRVVSGLAREWGTSTTAHGKTAWFEQALGRVPRPRSHTV